MQSTFLNTVAAIVTTLAIAFAALLAASLIFLYDRNPGEPPAASLVIGVGSLLIGERIVLRDRQALAKAAAIILGAILVWLLLPDVGGRFDSKVDELFSTDRNHFGAVTFTIAGGAIGSIAECVCRSAGRRRVNNGIADSAEAAR